MKLIRSLAIALAVQASVSVASAQTWTEIATISQPIGVACVGDGPDGIADKLVVTSYQHSATAGGVFVVQPDGTAQRLQIAGLPTWGSTEVYIAVSPGLGEWDLGTVYLIKGGTIYELSSDLSTATVFASVAGMPGTHSGITFDRTGVWNHDMIVSFRNGDVGRISATGAYSLIANIGVLGFGSLHEAPRVITNDLTKWGANAGCISTAAEAANRVFVTCPDGSVQTLASSITNAETSDVRPVAGEVTFENTSYVYVLSAFSRNRIVGYTAAQLPPGSEGDLFVSRESIGGIDRVTATGSKTNFAPAHNEHHEGSNFCVFAGTIDTAEVCDDGIDNDGDGLIDNADTDCHVCGDGDLDPGEECDDGNVENGDGCSNACQDEDSDGDGVPDPDDQCPGHDDNADADGDLIADGCDDCPDDADNDIDSDGLCAGVDNCDTVANPAQTDSDSDGHGDACDNCSDDPDNDIDGDDVCGDVDNCPNVPNADQSDLDSDGIGDYCDDCTDVDGDTVCDDADRCPGTATGADSVPTQRLGVNRWADTDGDGEFDTTEPNGNGPGRSYTISHTGGCSCSQIIDVCDYGAGHTKFGCSISVMDAWLAQEPVAGRPLGCKAQ